MARAGGDVRLTLAGGEIEARWAGAPAEDALVLLHEGLGSVAQWRGVPDELARRTGRPVFAYSRFGYGGSSRCALPRPHDYLEREAVDVLPRVLEAAGIRGGHLVGHSDGATIALLYAARCAPPGLRGLVLEAPHVFVEHACDDELRRAREAYERGDLRARLARYHGDQVDVAFYGWNDTWLDPAYGSWNIEALLPSVRVPSLVIQGENDRYGTRAHADAIVRRVGAPSTLLLLPCGHTPHRELPEETFGAIASFLERYP
ncbi:MAG TPA: alpha/beta fold hydrolase [Polyangiaceae bacterium]|nr:alpha/beta fold hydrolase [Polyangiaceae bacterium]